LGKYQLTQTRILDGECESLRGHADSSDLSVSKTGSAEVFKAETESELIRLLVTAKRNATAKIHTQEQQIKTLIRIIEKLMLKERIPGEKPSLELESLVESIMQDKS
jgi:hypothetical protein